jgi:hypothetical protein
MYLPRSLLLLIAYNPAVVSASGIRRRQLQGERIDSLVNAAADLRGGSRVDPENAELLEFAALRKVVLDGKCSDVCNVASNPDWVCADENSHLVCHQGRKTKCIPTVSFHTNCVRHNDTCGPCAADADDESELCGTCDGQGACEIEEVEICHKKRTTCVSSESWLGHCYNHGDTCGACPSIIEEEENDGDEDGDDGQDEGSQGVELDVSACAAPCSQEDDVGSLAALERCTEEDPNTFPICHKGKNTLCVSPDSWPGHCLRHSDTCGPCSASVEEVRVEPGTEAGSITDGSGDIPPENSAGGGNDNGNNGNGPSDNLNAGGNGNGNDGNDGNGDENPADGDLDDEGTTGGGSSNDPTDNSNVGGNGNQGAPDSEDGPEPNDEGDQPDNIDTGSDDEPTDQSSNAGGNGNGSGGSGGGCAFGTICPNNEASLDNESEPNDEGGPPDNIGTSPDDEPAEQSSNAGGNANGTGGSGCAFGTICPDNETSLDGEPEPNDEGGQPDNTDTNPDDEPAEQSSLAGGNGNGNGAGGSGGGCAFGTNC